MAHNSVISESLEYGRELIHAGFDGIRAGERLTLPETQIGRSAQQSLIAAVIGGTVALIGCRFAANRRRILGTMITCGTAAFCADFIWRTRNISSKMIECAEKEVEKVRDQHWLASHPIDYA